MKTCKNCKHFKIYPNADYEYAQTHGIKPENKGKIGTCYKTEFCSQFSSIPSIQNINGITSASEWGDSTNIIVGINFGCVLFEQKNKKK